MKKIGMLFVALVLVTTIEAKEKKDPVVMTVAGKEIPLSEFIYMARKDNSVDLNDKKSVDHYVELFKVYKLKVADAESLNIHKASKFEKELGDYTRQLQESYLSDKASEDSAMRVVYERLKYIPGFKHILFYLPGGELVPKDTVETYNKAVEAYNRIKNGESFESTGESLTSDPLRKDVLYVTEAHVYPMQMFKVLEDKIFSMEPGEISFPVRSTIGFHLFKLDRKIPNPGKVRVAHILTSFPSPNPTDEDVEQVRMKSDSIYRKILSGEDFSVLAEQYSSDTITAKRGGLLPYFGLGEMVEPFEKAAFAFEKIGDVSEPVKTRYGFHILKLIDKKTDMSFEELESQMYGAMKRTERNFDLYRGFGEKMKVRHGYVLYPEAYAELQRLADEYFPTDTSFVYRGLEMAKPLVHFDSIEFNQNDFVDYMNRRPTSAKTLSTDYMQEIFDLFVREVLTEMEREKLEQTYPEYKMILNEYYDGILLFEISNKRVWSRSAEEQEKLEAEWIKELNEKYPVTVNKKVIRKIKKYLD
ncbi:MAG: peptidyl-prolyl cis-trans isomerase [Tannerella sp.]|jgi:peptidyl-prolyl cis-trans isomerase SurA|nr:peptidyl-prolyl cis-trans isomerase [Tannerella sp.]